jgi:hypothetical protein
MMLRRHTLSTDVLMHAYPIRMSAIIERNEEERSH